MSETINEERLNDYVDGLLPEHEARAVELLLRGSAEARETVEFLRSLRTRAGELPRSIEPGRDLWPSIREKLAPAPLVAVGELAEAGRPARRGASRERAWWPRLEGLQWATLAAAAAVLVAVSSGLTAWMLVPASSPVTGPSGPTSPAAAGAALTPTGGSGVEEMRPIEAEFALEIEQLLWALYENRESLDPETVSTIETNLRVIDRAIGRAREALAEDPENPGLARMLTNNYRHKLELLQRASRIIELS